MIQDLHALFPQYEVDWDSMLWEKATVKRDRCLRRLGRRLPRWAAIWVDRVAPEYNGGPWDAMSLADAVELVRIAAQMMGLPCTVEGDTLRFSTGSVKVSVRMYLDIRQQIFLRNGDRCTVSRDLTMLVDSLRKVTQAPPAPQDQWVPVLDFFKH